MGFSIVNPPSAEIGIFPKLGQYHDCSCPGSLCHQVMSSHDIEYIGFVHVCLESARISTACTISDYMIDMKMQIHVYFQQKKNIGTQRVNKGQSYQCLLGYFFFFEEVCKFNSLTPLIKLIKCYESYFCYHLTNLNCLAITPPIVDSYLWLHMVSPGDTELTEGDFDSCHSLTRHVLVL